MNAITLELPDDVYLKVELAALHDGMSIKDFLENVATDIASQFDAFKEFEEKAARGRGREQEALELLRRK